MKQDELTKGLSWKISLLSLILISFLSGCDTVQDIVVSQLPTEEKPRFDSLEEAHMAAILDAAIAEPGEISRNLLAIVEHNDQLVWKESSVLMITWTNWDGYDANLGKSMPLKIPVWVTAAPKLQNFCKSYQPDGTITLDLRLEQLLGLAPHTSKTKFVEMWVNPLNIFRPCPDPEISDQECELDFPRSANFLTVNLDHRKWMMDNEAEKYPPSLDETKWFPWTRLGYTYDWGNSHSEVGLSEFVIEAGATVEIHSITPTLDYCK